MTDLETSQLGPSYDGTVVLDIGGDIGALVIMTAPDMHLVEIEISPGHVAARTHVAVRERRGPGAVRYAAIYPGLREGAYVVWDPAGRPATTAHTAGGKVTTLDWR